MSAIYPEVEVELVGQDGNAFAILGAVSKALKKANIPQKKIDECMTEMRSGDYDNLLRTAMKWVNVS